MATAPLETNTEAPQGGEQDAPRDYEGEARKMGWSSPDEFKGDPSKHVDAETFVKRGEEMMPFLKAQNKKLLQRMDQMERTGKQAAEYYTKAEERAYNRAVADIKAEMAAAVESGDNAAHDKAFKKFEELEKPGATAIEEPPAHDPARAADEFADWSKANKWYAQTDKAPLRIYADAQAELIAKPGAFLTPADLDEIARRVKAKFPEEFEAEGEAPQRRRSAVDGGNTIPPRRGGNTFNDLPPEAKAQCLRFERQGITRESYVKNFDFAGWNK